MEEMIELLRAWMDSHRQSILDGTTSCKICAALVLSDNAERHQNWHDEQAVPQVRLDQLAEWVADVESAVEGVKLTGKWCIKTLPRHPVLPGHTCMCDQ